jgi:hypothetical protein
MSGGLEKWRSRMMEDFEPSPEELERWTRNLLKPSKPTEDSAEEQAMIAKVFGTKTQAERFLRHERQMKTISSEARRSPVFKDRKPVLRFEYWERHGGSFGYSEWKIDRFENGKRVHTSSGDDWQKRDELLIKLQAAGVTCTPITVAGVVPAPIKGRMRDQRKKPSGRFGIMAQIGKLTSDDLEGLEDEY